MKEFLTKKVGGLPVWAWALIGVAGVGAGYLLIRWQGSKNTPASLTANSTPNLTTGNASGNETNPATGTVGSNGVIDNPFPESTVNGQQVPIIPPGYQAIYDQNGNIVGWGPMPVNPTPGGSSQPSQPAQPITPPHVPYHPNLPSPGQPSPQDSPTVAPSLTPATRYSRVA